MCLKEVLEQSAIVALRELLQTQAWQAKLEGLPGYRPWKSGEVLSLKAQLPWWNLPPKRSRRSA